LDNKDFPKVRKAAMKQGWISERTAAGEVFYAPDGSTKVAWHSAHASSDPHALDAFVRRLRATGSFVYPSQRRR
jgi:hypothetical protein